MEFHYIITTQHIGRHRSTITATSNGVIDVERGEREQDVYGRILDAESDRLGADKIGLGVLFYRLTPNDWPGGVCL